MIDAPEIGRERGYLQWYSLSPLPGERGRVRGIAVFIRRARFRFCTWRSKAGNTPAMALVRAAAIHSKSFRVSRLSPFSIDCSKNAKFSRRVQPKRHHVRHPFYAGMDGHAALHPTQSTEMPRRKRSPEQRGQTHAVCGTCIRRTACLAANSTLTVRPRWSFFEECGQCPIFVFEFVQAWAACCCADAGFPLTSILSLRARKSEMHAAIVTERERACLRRFSLFPLLGERVRVRGDTVSDEP